MKSEAETKGHSANSPSSDMKQVSDRRITQLTTALVREAEAQLEEAKRLSAIADGPKERDDLRGLSVRVTEAIVVNCRHLHTLRAIRHAVSYALHNPPEDNAE